MVRCRPRGGPSKIDVLKLYVQTLKERGVQNYTFEECLEDYRFGTLYCLVYAVIIIGTLDPTNARGLANSMPISSASQRRSPTSTPR